MVEPELVYYGSACYIRYDTHVCRVACWSRPSKHHTKWPRASFAVESAAALPWNRWQAWHGISGSFAVERVAALAWNQWQDSPGIGGSFRVEYAVVNGTAGIVAFDLRGRPFSVMGFTVRRGRIVEVDILADPARLG